MEHMGIGAVIHEPTVLLMTAAFSFVKSVIYGIMLWVTVLSIYSFPCTSTILDWLIIQPIFRSPMTFSQSSARLF